MPNIKTSITLPDPIFRMIAEGYSAEGVHRPTKEEMVEAFQEIVNFLAVSIWPEFQADMNDVMYFKDMDENIACWGDERIRTPVAEVIGQQFLVLLRERSKTPAYQALTEKKNPAQRRTFHMG